MNGSTPQGVLPHSTDLCIKSLMNKHNEAPR